MVSSRILWDMEWCEMSEELTESIGLGSANSGDALVEIGVIIELSILPVCLRRKWAGVRCETDIWFFNVRTALISCAYSSRDD